MVLGHQYYHHLRRPRRPGCGVCGGDSVGDGWEEGCDWIGWMRVDQERNE